MISDICCVVYFSYILQTRPYGLRQCKIYETILADVSEITLPSDNITLLDSFYSLISLPLYNSFEKRKSPYNFVQNIENPGKLLFGERYSGAVGT